VPLCYHIGDLDSHLSIESLGKDPDQPLTILISIDSSGVIAMSENHRGTKQRRPIAHWYHLAWYEVNS
jgi:hypothetical protein